MSEVGVELTALRERFEAEGFAVLRGAFTGARLAALQEAYDATIERHRAGLQELVGDEVWQLSGACRLNPTLREAFFDGRLGAVARALLGCEGVQLLQDVALFKPPGGGVIGWHEDHAYARYLEPARGLSMRIALDPEGAESGAMRVLRGSHRAGVRLDLSERNWFIEARGLEEHRPEVASRLAQEATLVELEPGDVSLHHCLTLHGSGENASERPRRTLIVHVFDAACRFNPDGLPVPEAADHFVTRADGGMAALQFPRLP